MGRWWVWAVALVMALAGLWALVWATNTWLLPALDCWFQGGEACSASALGGLVVAGAAAGLYAVWRVVRGLTGRPPRRPPR